MKQSLLKILGTIAALALSTSIALAVEPILPTAKDTKDAAKAAGKAEAKKAGAKADAAKAKDKVGAVKATATLEPVDINTATDAQLKAIPGIGDTYASKIIAGRPYAKKDQLKTRNVLPGPVYEQVKGGLVAKQPAKATTNKK